jgi:hypothetical protein
MHALDAGRLKMQNIYCYVKERMPILFGTMHYKTSSIGWMINKLILIYPLLSLLAFTIGDTLRINRSPASPL